VSAQQAAAAAAGRAAWFSLSYGSLQHAQDLKSDNIYCAIHYGTAAIAADFVYNASTAGLTVKPAMVGAG
jgi:hypothetical protein